MDLSKYTGKINELLRQAEERIRQFRVDPDLNEDAKAREIAGVQQNLRQQYPVERADAESLVEMDRKMAFRRAYPVEGTEGDSQAQIARELRRARVRDDLQALWEGRGGGPTLEEYNNAIATGDELRIEVIETYGPRMIQNDGVRQQFVAAVQENQRARMTDDQRQALEELETLQKAKYELAVALNFKDGEYRRLVDASAGRLASTMPA